MFKEAIFERERDFGRRAALFPLALLVHALIAAILLTVPLVRVGPLPEVEFLGVFLAPPPPVTPFAPPRRSRGGRGSESPSRISKVAASPNPGALIAPVDIPVNISAEPFGMIVVKGGVEGGVDYGPDSGWENVLPGWIFAPAVNDVREPLRAAGPVVPPKLVRRVEPAYPEIARQARVEGVVILEATTDIRGRVEALRVLRSIPLLDQAAIDAVKLWIYEPMVVSGRPRAVTFNVTVRFELR